MAEITGHKLQVVPQSRGRNLKIRIRKDCSSFFKLSADSAEDLGCADIKREDGYCRNDAIFYIAQFQRKIPYLLLTRWCVNYIYSNAKITE